MGPRLSPPPGRAMRGARCRLVEQPLTARDHKTQCFAPARVKWLGATFLMDKRFQVFVSSTYEDLQEERQEVMHALLELDRMPSGMELFPAANKDQWTVIKEVIDDSDYYLVVVGGRYGSLGLDGSPIRRWNTAMPLLLANLVSLSFMQILTLFPLGKPKELISGNKGSLLFVNWLSNVCVRLGTHRLSWDQL